MKISSLFKIVKWIFAYHTLSAFTFLAPAAEIGCFQVDTIASPQIDCSCGPFWRNGTCGSGTTSGTIYPFTYKKCNPGDGIDKDGGFKNCYNTNDFAAKSYTCTTSVDYTAIAFCKALAGATGFGCGSCLVVPNPVSCISCIGGLAGLGLSGCAGCVLVSCSVTMGKATRIDIYYDSSITCPSRG